MTVAVLGSVNLDVVLSVARLPKAGETVRALSKAHYQGGKGANQAVAAARAGARTLMLGAVGDDRIGQDLLRGLVEYDVGVENVVTLAGIDTGQAHILVSEAGENSIVIVPGANGAVSHLRTEPADVQSASVRLAQLEVPVDAIRSFFESEAAGLRVTRILNAAPAIFEARELFAVSDIIVVNETELEIFSGTQIDEDTARDALVTAARTLLTNDKQRVVVTIGAKGSVMVGRDEVFVAEGYPAQVVDTTGAGDCFCGVLASALSRGEQINQALRLANAAASLAVGKKGAGPSMPTANEIHQKIDALQ